MQLGSSTATVGCCTAALLLPSSTASAAALYSKAAVLLLYCCCTAAVLLPSSTASAAALYSKAAVRLLYAALLLLYCCLAPLPSSTASAAVLYSKAAVKRQYCCFTGAGDLILDERDPPPPYKQSLGVEKGLRHINTGINTGITLARRYEDPEMKGVNDEISRRGTPNEQVNLLY